MTTAQLVFTIEVPEGLEVSEVEAGPPQTHIRTKGQDTEGLLARNWVVNVLGITALPEPLHTLTNRGFKHIDPIVADYSTVKVYEASTATAPFIWLTIEEGSESRVDLKAGDATAHLTLDEARQLAAQIIWLADHHYQRRAAPRASTREET